MTLIYCIEIGMLHNGLLIKLSKLYCNRTGILYCGVLQGWLLEHQIGNLESATARPIVATTATSLQSFSTWNNWYWIEQFGFFSSSNSKYSTGLCWTIFLGIWSPRKGQGFIPEYRQQQEMSIWEKSFQVEKLFLNF